MTNLEHLLIALAVQAVLGFATGNWWIGATYAAYGGATGFGSPTGAAIIANFPGATATLAQTSQTVAEILVVLKGLGFISA